MDHFARPDDELAVAQRAGPAAAQLPGLLDAARERPDRPRRLGDRPASARPTTRTQRRSTTTTPRSTPAGCRWCAASSSRADDLVRRAVIQALMCHFRVSIESIELALPDRLPRVLRAPSCSDLRRAARRGPGRASSDDWISVTPRGRLLVRAVCMVFDRYLRERAGARLVLAGDLACAALCAAALLGLASGMHCVGMCGGFVAAFAAARHHDPSAQAAPWQRLLVFNAGRITQLCAGRRARRRGRQCQYLPCCRRRRALHRRQRNAHRHRPASRRRAHRCR